jgi:UDP-2,4-diacetamido-2,4,6-trideoxy-beta-L-altropyranose hydrolase
MRIVFRVDGSSKIGSGHVMRCLTFASAFRKRGAQVDFVCREHDSHFCDLIQAQGYKVYRLLIPIFSDIIDHAAYADWLSVPWQIDAEETRKAISRGIKPKLLVVDHYAIDVRWENYLRPSVEQIFVIDDLANRVHDADFLLDQNLIENFKHRYDKKIPKDCISLLGPKYSLLHPIYQELRKTCKIRFGPIKRILIFFGGADPMNMTGMVLSAFISLKRFDIEVDVVINNSSPHIHSIFQQKAGLSNIHLHMNLSSLAPLIMAADLGIGACGISSWERLCLGLPSIVITIADNQHPIAKELHKLGLVNWVGSFDNVNEKIIVQTLDSLLLSGLDNEWSQQCFAQVDGGGLERVFERILLNE